MGKKKVIASIGTTIQTKTGGKVYSQKVESSSSNFKQDDDILKVELSTTLTDTLVRLILEHMKSNNPSDNAVHASRLTQFKLSEIYQNLADIGFKSKEIESAMNNCIPAGGDLISMLDWLCLNTQNDCLPSGFSEFLEKASVKKSPFTMKKDEKKIVKQEPPKKVNKPKKNTVYLNETDLPNYDSDCSDIEIDESKVVEDEPEDMNSTYLELYAKFMDMKTKAAQAKADKDKAMRKICSKDLTKLLCEMDKIEKMDCFDSRIKIDLAEKDNREVKISENKTAGDGDTNGNSGDNDMNVFGIFEESKAEVSKTEVVQEKTSPDSRELVDFTYTRKQWTGKSPKQFLIDWMRKNMPKAPVATYNKSQKRGGGYVCRIKYTARNGATTEQSPSIHCLHAKDSEYLAATLALYKLCAGQSVHQLLPPVYRDVWLDWIAEDKAAKQNDVKAVNKPRDDYVTRLFKRLNVAEKKSKAAESIQDDLPNEDVDQDSDVNDNWEDLDSDENVEENLEVVEVKRQSKSEHHTKTKMHHNNTSYNNAPPTANLLKLLTTCGRTPMHEDLLKTRRQLPVYKHRQEILDMISDNRVILIMGETGSGKSTQIPQFLLEEFLATDGNIVCTQPRRVSATSLATRVANEIGTAPPGCQKFTMHSLCGYQIRFESKTTRTTRLTYCTTGVLLRQLINDPHLDRITHIIIDEVHERNIQSDFLLILLKRILSRRDCKLKVILMSATIDQSLFSRYFNDCPVLSIPGRCFPVQVMHLEDILEMTPYQMDRECKYAIREHNLVEERSSKFKVKMENGKSRMQSATYTSDDLYSIDYTDLGAEYALSTRNLITRMRLDIVNVELIVELLKAIHTNDCYHNVKGGILIFLPGFQAIQELKNLLLSEKLFSNPKKYKIVTMHSLLTSDEQSQAFKNPGGATKIVLATNIAESGITIPDIVFVIDTGRVKETRYMESCEMSKLTEVNVSQASAKQRKGRAGRVKDGFCFRMFSQKTYEEMKAFTTAEIVRVPLEELCLHIMKSNYGDPGEFLTEALDPPSQQNIRRAMSILYTVGACYYDDQVTCPLLTALGNHLAILPIDVKLGKMLIFGSIFGVLEETAIIAASMSVKSIFSISTENRNEADTIIANSAFSNSDHLTAYKLYLGEREYCEFMLTIATRWTLVKNTAQEHKYIAKYYLNRSSLQEINKLSEDLVKQLKAAGFGDVDLSTLLKTTVKHTKKSNIVRDGVVNISETTDILATIQASKLSKPIIAVLKCVITASLYPNIAITHPKKDIQNSKMPCTALTSQGTVSCHPSSVNFKLNKTGWLAFNEKMKSTKAYIRQSTLISPYCILLFGGNIHIEHTSMLVNIDNFATFKACAKTAVIFKELRNLINEHLLQRFTKQGEIGYFTQTIM